MAEGEEEHRDDAGALARGTDPNGRDQAGELLLVLRGSALIAQAAAAHDEVDDGRDLAVGGDRGLLEHTLRRLSSEHRPLVRTCRAKLRRLPIHEDEVSEKASE